MQNQSFISIMTTWYQ